MMNSFLPKNNVHPISISHKTDVNKVYHQQNVKHSFDLSSQSNTHNGAEDVILMKEADSSGIQKKSNETGVSTTGEINNNNATKEDHSHTTKNDNNSTGQYKNEKKEQHQIGDKNDRKKEKSDIILGGSIVKHINGWEISKRLLQCKVYIKYFPCAETRCMKNYLKPSLCQNPSHFILHMVTSDLKSVKSSKARANEIMNIAISLEIEAHNVTLSNIIVRCHSP